MGKIYLICAFLVLLSAVESQRQSRQNGRFQGRTNLPFSPTGAGLTPPNIGAQINNGLFGAPQKLQNARLNLPVSPFANTQTPRSNLPVSPTNFEAQTLRPNLPVAPTNFGAQTPKPNLPVSPTNFGAQTTTPNLPVSQTSFQGNINLPVSHTSFDSSVNFPVTPVPTENFQASFSGHFGTSGAAVNVGINLEQLLEEEWLAFKTQFNKNYPTPEIENFRREVFIENRGKIARFNTEYGQGKRSFVQQLNPYGDLLFNEFNTQLNGYNRSIGGRPRSPYPNGSTFIPSANVILPGDMDWRQVGAVSKVKNQGKCAGCWAFAAAGALEGHNFRKTGSLVELSPQNLIDCVKGDNAGCQGGNVNPAFDYVKNNPGIDTEESYPYEAKDGPCRFKPETVGGVCTGFVDIAEGDEKGLEIAVATIGPVAAAIDASKQTLQFYSEGVYFDEECGNKLESLNHAILIVGFGTEPDGQKYWLVKNSYGDMWGQGGYIKMAKDRNNHCGIASAASYPLV